MVDACGEALWARATAKAVAMEVKTAELRMVNGKCERRDPVLSEVR